MAGLHDVLRFSSNFSEYTANEAGLPSLDALLDHLSQNILKRFGCDTEAASVDLERVTEHRFRVFGFANSHQTATLFQGFVTWVPVVGCFRSYWMSERESRPTEGHGIHSATKLSADTSFKIHLLRRRINAENCEHENHPWAGDYFAGDGLGFKGSFVISPTLGFAFEFRGCLGLYDQNYGVVTYANDRLHLSFAFEHENNGLQCIAPVLIPVIWDSRRYLIPANDVVGFCNDINSGVEPRGAINGNYLLRRGDERKPVRALPQLPDE